MALFKITLKVSFKKYFTQLLLNPEMMKASPALAHYVYDFLENKAYSKGKGDFARKVRIIFNINETLVEHLLVWRLH